MLWAALNELSPRNRLRLLILTYGPLFLTCSLVFCWRSDSPLPGAASVAVQGFLLLPLVTCEIPAMCCVFMMDALPTGNCSFWCSVWCLCFMSGPYLLICFMTSLPILIFSHSKFSLLPTPPVWLAQLVACIWFLGHRLWLNASCFRWHVSIVLKPFSAFYEFFALSKRSMHRHLALPIRHLQLYL